MTTPEVTPTPGGASGGAEESAAASSQIQSDAELLASQEQVQPETPPDPNAEFWAKAKELDFSKAPEEVRQKIEAPFLSQYGRKTTELERKRQDDNDRLLTIIERFMTSKGQEQPQPDQREELRQKLAEGDVTAVEGLMERMFNDRYGPQMAFISNKQAIETAQSLMPDLPKYEAQVAETLKNDKNLLYLATVNNRQFAPQVLAGLAYQAAYNELRGQVDSIKSSVEQAKKQAVDEYKAQLRGLSTSTSQAGKTPTAFAKAEMSLDEIRDQAWRDAGGH